MYNFYISIFCGVNCDIYVYCRLCVSGFVVAFDNAGEAYLVKLIMVKAS